jgi:hypothetical protein
MFTDRYLKALANELIVNGGFASVEIRFNPFDVSMFEAIEESTLVTFRTGK